jgi:hypothetical protein
MKTNIEPLQADSYYHIYNRGINGENIFKEERNYAYFLQKYTQFVSPIAETYSYCFMKNHFHLLVKTRSESEIKLLEYASSRNTNKPIHWLLSNAFASFFKSYSQTINKAYKRTGRLFEEPFRRIWVDKDDYFTELIYYIHHNPEKHCFINDFREYPHSSYQSHLRTATTRLQRDVVLKWFGGRQEFEKFHARGDTYNNLDKFEIECG